MKLKQLEYFMAIAEEHQISAAARKLHIAQPPLTYELKSLEAELGVQLITRGVRRCELTAAGRLLYQRAGQVLAMVNTTVHEVSNCGRGLAGVLSIGAISSSGGQIPNQMMTHFTQYYPQVRFEIHEGNTFQLIEMLQAGIIDLGIVRTPFVAEQLKICYGPQEPMVAVMTPDRAIAFTQPKITLAQLSGQPLIFYRRFEQLLTNCMQNEGLNLQVACLNDDARTTFNWAANNFGIGILPLSIIQTLNNNNMVVKIIDCEKLVTRLAVIWDEHRYQSPLAAQFIEDFQKSVNSVISVKDDK